MARTPPFAVPGKAFEQVPHIAVGPVFVRQTGQTVLPASAAHGAGDADGNVGEGCKGVRHRRNIAGTLAIKGTLAASPYFPSG